MSVYVGPGEGVEGEGCRPSIDIYIDICTGYMCLFLSLYRMYIYTDMFTWTYPSFCVDTFVFIYPYVSIRMYTYILMYCRQRVQGIYPLLQFGRDLSVCLFVSLSLLSY